FTRQLLFSDGPIDISQEGDRVAPILMNIQFKLIPLMGANAFSEFFFETPDADDLKSLSGYCKSLSRPTENALNKAKLLPKGKGAAHLPRLHLVMVSESALWPTISYVNNSSPWSMGIPRLRFPAQAPSRSTLKLEEAFITFLDRERSSEMLRPGMTAVDLGASPGGWTYQLVQRGIHVAAIDNGPMDADLMKSGLVTHHEDDAFRFRPLKPVNWLVCDVVEQPSKITDLMTEWLLEGLCEQAIFNLKLPMKRRFHEIELCLEKIRSDCQLRGIQIVSRCKQLYHDRKEVTVYVRRV
ncbi:MAG: 23S rRNA (cytidine(2498)-2'-O)-methyltransferase RlmM, partial [Proteobacteria bacterium]|nr:23S rRNA (cytidine(2498)-2'-O)-methyltransferase RlmM [Pseudomonadota bacterium]